MQPIVIYHLIVAAIALGMIGTALLNFLTFSKPRAYIATGDDDALPLISILVPARNEEDNIEACIRSLLNLNYPNFEVIALDDNSTDDTYDILCRLRDQDYRLRVLVGATLPEGWYGKPHACWQMANAAKGEYLLLTDADCIFTPDAALLALGAMQQHDADVVSLVPDLQTQGFWEQLLIPIQYFIIFAFLPTPLIRKTNHPWFAAANGAFLFLRRDTYFEVDGHRAVRQQLAEDVKFAQYVKRCGKTLWYGDGSRTYGVRMYHGLSEIWTGFTKNLFPAFSSNIPLLLTVIGVIALTQILPLFFTLWGWMTGASWTLIPALTYFGLVCVRLGLTGRFGKDAPEYALLSPIAWSIVIGIALNSIYRATHNGMEWKGRIYSGKK